MKKTLGLFLLLTISITAFAAGRDVAPAPIAHQMTPALASNGSTVLAAWIEFDGTSSQVRASIVGSGTSVDLTDKITQSSAGYPSNVVAASGGDGFLVVWMAGDWGGVVAKRLTREGVVLDERPIVLSEGQIAGQPAVAWNGSEFLIVWTELHSVAGATLAPSGVVTGRVVIDDNPAASLALAWNGSEFMIAWEHFVPTEADFIGTTLLVAPLNDRGQRVTGDAAALARYTWTQSFPKIATSGDEFYVTFREWDSIKGSVIRPDGSVATPTPLFRWRPERFIAHDVAWDGTRYNVAVRYGISTNPSFESPDIEDFVASFVGDITVNRDGVVDGMTFTPAGPYFLAPQIAIATRNGMSLIATTERRTSAETVIVGYDNSDLTPAPSPPDPPADVAALEAGRQRVMLTWSDRSTNEEGFLAGNVLHFVSTPRDADRAVWEGLFAGPPATAFVQAWSAGGFSAPALATRFSNPRRRTVR